MLAASELHSCCWPQPITEMTLEDWDRMMAVHLRGAFLVSREAAKHMIPRKRG